MKGLLCALGTCLVVAQTFAGLPLPGEQGGVWTDTNGARINAHGACMLWHAGRYYWYGNLSGVCVGTGAKNDRVHYLGRKRVNGDPHGQAPMLWCANAWLER